MELELTSREGPTGSCQWGHVERVFLARILGTLLTGFAMKVPSDQSLAYSESQFSHMKWWLSKIISRFHEP